MSGRQIMRPAPRLLGAAFVALLLLPFTAPAHAEVDIDAGTFGGLRARAIGPAVMGGRIAAIDAVGEDPLTIYVGAASGGVWKSVDGGLAFQPVFDDHNQSIGAIEIDPSDPETVWVGTGETWVRNTVSVGDGLYKTTDGGDNWTRVGLEDSERIATIRVDPTDGDTVYACVTGHLFNDHETRGVYKTTDGGESWKQILYVDEKTGCADLDMDPQEPKVLYAAMWQFRRSPDFFNSGGPGSGLYQSTDGGETWNELTNGLPKGDLGRIAVAVAPSRPSTVYATVEADESALFRSDDLGKSWTNVNSSMNVTVRPFYFSELIIDPKDHLRVYKPGLFLTISTDGGKSFSSMFGGGFSISVHPDHHALWINPKNPHEILLGTDGGLYASYDRANHWRHVQSLPISQFYHVSHDMKWPYDVYGGLQDNNSWVGPSRGPNGVGNCDWEVIGIGDGFWAFPDPEDNNIIYTEYQGGQLLRVNRELKSVKQIKPFSDAETEELRFNWNTPIHLSPNDTKTIYYGSQFLHRSRDRGETWERISPDLTTDDPARQRQAETGGLTIDNSTAENNTTIYAIHEAPKNPDVIWVGTDDGNVQITRDGGETWSNVVSNIPGVPEMTWVSSVEASPHAEGTAFVTFDGHRSGDMAIYAFRTDDFGASWTSITTDEIAGYVWKIIQDPVNPDLLFLGTEFGLFVSLDGGGEWTRFEENLPKVAVHDIVIHPTEHDVILATHGRGIQIIDDITALRALTPEVVESNVALLPSRPSPMTITTQLSGFSSGEYIGETVPEAAAITFYQKKRHLFGDLKLEIYDQDDKLITTLPAPKRRGLNRVYWPMRFKAPKLPAATTLVPAFLGPRLLEGTYRVKLVKGKEDVEGTVELVADPRSPHSKEDRLFQQTTALELYDRLADLTYLVDTLVDLRDQAEARAEALSRAGDKEKLQGFADRLEEIRGGLVATSTEGYVSGDEKLREDLGNLYGAIVSYDGRPSNSQLTRKDVLLGELSKAEADVEAYISGELPELDKLLERRDLEPFAKTDREAWNEEEGVGGAAMLATDVLELWLPRWLDAGPRLF